MAIKKKKISELPLADTLVGLYTIGVNVLNKSVKVGLAFLKTAADAATRAATAANTAAENANTAAAVANEAAGGIADVVDLLAHTGCSLDERVAALERQLMDVMSGGVVVPELQVTRLGVWGGNNLTLAGAGAPTAAPDRAGQFYIDTTARALYYATGNSAISDWKNA